MKIPQHIITDAIAMAHNWQTPIRIFAGSQRCEPDPSDLRGKWTATRGDRTWWYPGPAILVATVVETATGVEIESEL